MQQVPKVIVKATEEPTRDPPTGRALGAGVQTAEDTGSQKVAHGSKRAPKVGAKRAGEVWGGLLARLTRPTHSSLSKVTRALK